MARFAYRLPSFATDFSAAISMISTMKGMSVLHAPSGCMGDYCSFDEPDWVRSPGLTYCSMLKEDETIFGNDEILLGKIDDACEKVSPPFVAVIGSPITALIGTDMQGIAEISENRTGIPTIAVDTTGFGTYQDGLFKAFASCLDKFGFDGEGNKGTVILGIDKFDYHTCADREFLESKVRSAGHDPAGCMPGDGVAFFDDLAHADSCLAVSVAGMRMARLLRKRFGTKTDILSYEPEGSCRSNGKRCLVIGDQVVSGYIRDIVTSGYGYECDVGTLFGFESSISEGNDFRADSEKELRDRLGSERYDVIICDPKVGSLAPEGTEVIAMPHPAVSSKIHWNDFVPLKDVPRYLDGKL